MENEFSIRINLTIKELEVVGNQQFIEENFEKYLQLINNEITSIGKTPSKETEGKPISIPETFGEFYQRFIGRKVTGVDQFLIGAFFIAEKNEKKAFTTSKVNVLLKEKGIKLTNPSQAKKRNEEKGFIFPCSGDEFKFSINGENHITALMNDES